MDGGRAVGFIFANGRSLPWECSTFSLSANTNKRRLMLNLGDARGKEALRKLIATADIVLENFSPRVMEGFGVDQEFVRAANPRAIYVCMAPGNAQGRPGLATGPKRNRPCGARPNLMRNRRAGSVSNTSST